jgi:ATP-dependent RNA helicase DeaD
MPKEIVILAKQVTENPELIYTAMEKPTVKNCEQFYVSVDSPRKLELLVRLLGDENPAKGMVFTRTKRAADKIAEKLRRRGLDAGEIHGDLRQRRREAILGKFREGNLAVLVATDVAARGLDIQGVTHVVNYDIPEDPEDYVHRIGRTARMGQSGRAFTFVTPADGKWLMQIEKLINLQVPHYDVEGFRLKATDEEKSQEQGRRPASTHPMASKLSPALLNILANRKAPPRGGGRGGPRGGGKGGRGGGRGGPRGGGKGGRGGGRR